MSVRRQVSLHLSFSCMVQCLWIKAFANICIRKHSSIVKLTYLLLSLSPSPSTFQGSKDKDLSFPSLEKICLHSRIMVGSLCLFFLCLCISLCFSFSRRKHGQLCIKSEFPNLGISPLSWTHPHTVITSGPHFVDTVRWGLGEPV